MPRFRDIPQFPYGNYAVDVSWDFLREHLKHHVEDYNLDTDPDFQREHVWTREQQISYVEFILRGGQSGRDLLLNCPNWHSVARDLGNYVLVDGKQRLTAVLAFLNNELPAFSYFHRDFTDKLTMSGPSFKWRIASLDTRAEILEWYLAFNSGGTVHTKKELDRVRAMLEEERRV